MKTRRLFSILAVMALIFIRLEAKPTAVHIDNEQTSIEAEVTASPPHTFTCNLEQYTIDLEYDKESQEITRAEFSFEFINLKSGNEKRDKKMLGWMDIDQNPGASFKLKSTEKQPDGSYLGKGDYTMHGITKSLEIPFTLVIVGDHLILKGSVPINYMDFGLPKIRLFIFTVKPDMIINIHLDGKIR